MAPARAAHLVAAYAAVTTHHFSVDDGTGQATVLEKISVERAAYGSETPSSGPLPCETQVMLVIPFDESVLEVDHPAEVPAVPVLVADHHDRLAETRC